MIYVYEDEINDYLKRGYSIEQLHVMPNMYDDTDDSDLEEIRAVVKSVISEIGEFNNNKTFTPPPNVAQRAQSAINVVSSNNLTQTLSSGSGISKAKELATKQVQNFDMMRKMKSFFDTNEQDYKADVSAGKTINNSGTVQSWELHGGDSGRDWVNQELNSLNSDNLNTKKNLRKAGGAGINKGMGIFDKNMMSTNNHRIHR